MGMLYDCVLDDSYYDSMMDDPNGYGYGEYGGYGGTPYIYECGDFGNPDCQCNIECRDHGSKMCHYTKIVKLTNNDLVLEMHWCDDDVYTWSFKRISKPSNLKYRDY